MKSLKLCPVGERLLLLMVATLLSLVVGSATYAKEKKQVATKGIMNSIFSPLSEVLPLSFRGNEFTAKKNRAKVLKALKQLATNANQLEKHAAIRDRGFAYVAKSLVRDAKDLHRWYAQGWYNEARFTLHHITENCISCHSKYPGKSDYPGAQQFIKNVDLAKLPLLKKAHLQVVTRQFGEALGTYEKLFDQKELHPSIVVQMDAFTDYMKLSIRVKNDPKRPIATLQKIRSRKATPKHVQNRIQTWITDLRQVNKRKSLASNKPLNEAKWLVAEARKKMDFPRDREGLVHFITASALLQKYVNGRPQRGKDVGEAYYLLGQTEGLLGRSFWLSQMEFYLETAVRLSPKSDFASKAYGLLEEQLVLGFTGSSGTHIPDDVRALLNELKGLIEGNQEVKI